VTDGAFRLLGVDSRGLSSFPLPVALSCSPMMPNFFVRRGRWRSSSFAAETRPFLDITVRTARVSMTPRTESRTVGCPRGWGRVGEVHVTGWQQCGNADRCLRCFNGSELDLRLFQKLLAVYGGDGYGIEADPYRLLAFVGMSWSGG